MWHRLDETFFSLRQIAVGMIIEINPTIREIIVLSLIAAFALFAYYVYETE